MKTKIKIAFLVLGFHFLLVLPAIAQLELPYNGTFMYQTLTNPAHTERDSNFQVFFVNRDQWSGVIGAPSSQVLSAHYPLATNSNLGTNIFRNAAGVSERFTFDLFYNYTIRMEDANLKLGLLASFQQERRDYTQDDILLQDPLETDELIAEGIYSFSSLNTGVGLVYEKEKFNLGISAPRLLSNRFGVFNSENVKNNTPIFVYANTYFRLARGIQMRNRLNLQFDSDQFSLLQFFTGVNYQNNLEGGVQINTQITNGFNLQSLDAILALTIHPSFRLGLSYTIPLNLINQISPGSFEVFATYILPIFE